jgi:hypothetical protein
MLIAKGGRPYPPPTTTQKHSVESTGRTLARKAISNDRYRLVGTYERLRKRVLEMPDDGRLDKPLSYWVLPTDRRLPIPFLDRSLRSICSEPFDNLLATPGVGHKKILGFFDLLKRASGPLPDQRGETSVIEQVDESRYLDVYLDPGQSSSDLIRDFFVALDVLYQAHGGSGLMIRGHEHFAMATESVE